MKKHAEKLALKNSKSVREKLRKAEDNGCSGRTIIDRRSFGGKRTAFT
jgi:hypothetical protein